MAAPISSAPIPRLSRRLFVGIGLGFLAIVVTLVTAVVVVWRSQRAIERDLERIVSVEEPTSAAAFEMEINALGAGLAVYKYVISGDPEHLQRVAKDGADFERHWKEYERLATTPEERELAGAIADLHARYRAAGLALIEMREQPEQVLSAGERNFTRLRAELDSLIDEGIQAGTRSDLLAALEDTKTNLARLRSGAHRRGSAGIPDRGRVDLPALGAASRSECRRAAAHGLPPAGLGGAPWHALEPAGHRTGGGARTHRPRAARRAGPGPRGPIPRAGVAAAPCARHERRRGMGPLGVRVRAPEPAGAHPGHGRRGARRRAAPAAGAPR